MTLRIFAAKTENTPQGHKKTARQLLHLAVFSMFGCDDGELGYSVDENGKPFFLRRTDIHFNISHSGEYAVCAVGDVPCGIDIEKNDREVSERVRKRYLNGPAGQDAVTDWTRRESCGKLSGKGFLTDDFTKDRLQYFRFRTYRCLDGYTVTLCTGLDAGVSPEKIEGI